MNDDNYITPTKKHPVFTASCSLFGYIERCFYKQYKIKLRDNSYLVGDPFALNLTEAIAELHSWIQEESEWLKDNKQANFSIHMIDGLLDKWGEPQRLKVYEISYRKAIKTKVVIHYS